MAFNKSLTYLTWIFYGDMDKVLQKTGCFVLGILKTESFQYSKAKTS
jgi:hypothetical protein